MSAAAPRSRPRSRADGSGTNSPSSSGDNHSFLHSPCIQSLQSHARIDAENRGNGRFERCAAGIRIAHLVSRHPPSPMNEEFGVRLRQERERRKISLDSIAATTKVNVAL